MNYANYYTESDAEFEFIKNRMLNTGVGFIWTSGRKCNFDDCKNRPGKSNCEGTKDEFRGKFLFDFQTLNQQLFEDGIGQDPE